MAQAPEALPDDVAALKAALIAERARGLEIAAELAVHATEELSHALTIAKLIDPNCRYNLDRIGSTFGVP